MLAAFNRRAGITAAAVFVLLIAVALGVVAAVDAGYFNRQFIHYVSGRVSRQIQVQGSLRVHLLSFHPWLTAERVTIANPPWTAAGQTAEIGKVSLVLSLPGMGHSAGIDRLELDEATLHLLRDAAGHANWQLTDPGKGSVKDAWIVRSLSIQRAHVLLDDARRHLQFDGVVSAADVKAATGPAALRIEGNGQLNGRTARFEITGDPLAAVNRDRPYGFTFRENSSGTRLTGSGSVLRPFNFDALDATFDAVGANLKDLYYLAGVTLVNTGDYHLSGRAMRRGAITEFSDVEVTSGHSDARGTVSIDSSSGRPAMNALLKSRELHLSDLGLRAANRDAGTGAQDDGRSEAQSKTLLLSDAAISAPGVRHGEAVVSFSAQRVEAGRLTLLGVAAQMTIDHGVLVVAPLTANLLGGKLTAHLRLDATKDIPAVHLDMTMVDLQLGQLDLKNPTQPPLEGLLRVRVTVTGQGSSIHQVASNANGTVTAVLPHGTMRASLAELTGIDLRGLGLLLDHKKPETVIRCGVASFRAQQGTLTSQSLVLDTDPVLITGTGSIHLDSEVLDLAFRGHPKSVRLMRVRSPLLLHGTLAHPSIGIPVRGSVGQTAEAIALGLVLTPLAAVLAFVDPGLAKDADCASLLADAKNHGVR